MNYIEVLFPQSGQSETFTVHAAGSSETLNTRRHITKDGYP
jgi:hypothetical protein